MATMTSCDILLYHPDLGGSKGGGTECPRDKGKQRQCPLQALKKVYMVRAH